MYSYTRKSKKKKHIVIGTLSFALVAALLGIGYVSQLTQPQVEETPVVKEEVSIPVIALPKTEEVAIRPYKVDATIVLDYYDGDASEVSSMTKFEGTYRANQGIDYGYNKEAFDILAIFSGEVTDVKEDPLFGHSVTIQTGDIAITYQSLKDMKLQVGDQVKQGDALSLASTNVYNKDLGNHVHIVVTKNNILMNPENIYGKKASEI